MGLKFCAVETTSRCRRPSLLTPSPPTHYKGATSLKGGVGVYGHYITSLSGVVNPPSRLIIWSRETGSAVPSRVILLILNTQNKCHLLISSRAVLRLNRHQISPESYQVKRLRTDDVYRPASPDTEQVDFIVQ